MATILIVDDDPDIQEICRLVLEVEGHQVHSAFNRQEGMAAVAEHAPELVMLDVMMQEENDGVAMARDLRAQGFCRPILMLSGLARAALDGPDSPPVDGFQEKPIDPGELIAKIAALLDGAA